VSPGPAGHWLRDGLNVSEDPDLETFIDGLGALLDELQLPALDLGASTVETSRSGVHVGLSHRHDGRTVDIAVVGEIVVSYGPEHEHFASDDADLGRVWPFEEDTHVAQAISFIRYLLTGRIEVDVWRRPLALKTRSYWIGEDGQRELFLRGGTIGPFFGWSRTPETHTFDFTV